MALRTIRIIGDELLRKKSREVTEINDRILDLLDDMAETMYETGGVGLAAPQVGVLRRVVVIDVGDGLFEFINPVILEQSGEDTQLEGCLSVPEQVGDVTRPAHVKVRAQDRNGEEFILEADGFFAKAVCHELDHLDGVIFVDKAEKLYSKDEFEFDEE
ncbi:MAG: peptide deformylase [Clostridia bacterium]|nr:peptide deformylase [Clostridia bacterium]